MKINDDDDDDDDELASDNLYSPSYTVGTINNNKSSKSFEKSASLVGA